MSAPRPFRFQARRPKRWNGRYARVPGDTTAIHIRQLDGEWWPVIDWALDDEIAHCRMLDRGDVAEFAAAVCAGKRALGAPPGGSFLVNEFGQVLVPASDRVGARVVLAGECEGPFVFRNPFKPGSSFDLASTRGLKSGDRWERPYLGIPHNLSRGSELYFKRVDGGGETYERPPVQDANLVAALRRIRPWGPVRFLIGVGGTVITKVEPAWEPRFVGRIDHRCWFKKEGW